MKKCLGDVSYLEKNENELWRACRRHGVALDDDGNPIEPIRPAEPGDNGYIPFTIGGSDIGAIAGDSHFAAKTPLSVYNKKLGLVEEGKIDEMLALIGHSLEDGVAQITLGELKKIFGDGVELIQDGNLYQNTEHPWNLIDMDRLVRIPQASVPRFRSILRDERAEELVALGRDVIVVLECKTTRPFLDMRSLWKAGVYGTAEGDEGLAPADYVDQVRDYCATYEADIGLISVLWDTTGVTSVWIPRDRSAEEYLLKCGDEFIARLEERIPPEPTEEEAVATAASIIDDLAVSSAASKEIPLMEDKIPAIEEYGRLQLEYEAANKRVTTLKRQIEKIRVPFMQAAGSDILVATGTDGTTYRFRMKPRAHYVLDEVRLRAEAPDVFEAYAKVDAAALKRENNPLYSLYAKNEPQGTPTLEIIKPPKEGMLS